MNQTKVKKSLKVLGIFIVGMLVESYLVSIQPATKPAGPTLSQVTYQVPDELATVGGQLGLQTEQLVEVHAQIGLAGGCGQVVSVGGCYDPSTSTIRIPVSDFTSNIQVGSFAYEFMHYVWDKKSSATEVSKITPDIYTFYNTVSGNRRFQEEFKGLSSEGSLHSTAITNELQSMACTEALDADLTPQLLGYCNAYIPNRSILTRNY